MSRSVEVAPDTLHRGLAGETVLINLASGGCFRLDSTANRFWELILEHRDQELVEQKLVSEFDAEPERIAADLAHFVQQLVERGLVEIR